MKGYWHFIALSVGMSVLTIVFNNYWFIIGFFLWLFYLFYYERLGRLPLVISLICFLFFIIYIPAKEIEIDPMSTNPTEQNEFIGEIVSPLSITHKKMEFVFQTQAVNNKLLIIYFPNEKDPYPPKKELSLLKHGAICEINGNIELPNESRNPGQFNYRNYLMSQGITHQIIVESLGDIQCDGSSFLNGIYSIRLNLIDSVTQKMSTETSSWLNALVLGDDSELNENLVELFQRWSLSHILAISGLHVGLIVALVYFIIVKLNIVTKEKAQWIMIFFLPFYALIAGGQPSVWRASTMVLLFIIINKLKLKFSATDTLSIVFILLIIFDKYIVYHIGFQLSFIVTLGLVLSRHLISNTNSALFQGLQISFVSQMMILPLQLAYFSTFQPLSIVLNTIVVPYFSLFVIPLMFLMLLFSPLPQIFIRIVDVFFVKIHSVVLSLIELLDSIANYPLILGDFPVIIAVVYYCMFFLIMKNIQNGKLTEAFKHGTLLTLLLVLLAIRPYLSPFGTVTMLDIGQGDAFVIELPYRKAVFLIDAGAGFSFEDLQPTEKVYKQVIRPYLYSRGISHIDAIILSHEDLDHIGSVPYLIEEMTVDQIIISNYYELESDAALLWEKHGIQIKRTNPNESIIIGGQALQVLEPAENKYSENENSLVLYTELGGISWLFTGDIGVETERELIRKYEQLHVDVLKVAHHGSNTSTDPEFVRVINPRYALISAGVNNSYGHPTMDVLATLEDANVHVLRTDEDGAVQFRFKKNGGTFFKYLP